MSDLIWFPSGGEVCRWMEPKYCELCGAQFFREKPLEARGGRKLCKACERKPALAVDDRDLNIRPQIHRSLGQRRKTEKAP